MDSSTKYRRGFTLIELMVTLLIASFIFVGAAIMLADGIRGYRRMFERVHGEVVNDSYVARLRFDKVCRQAYSGAASVSEDKSVLTVYYFNETTEEIDRYAEFYFNDVTNTLMLETGTCNDSKEKTGQTSSEVVAKNVTAVEFEEYDKKTVRMVMTIDSHGNENTDDDHSIMITCSSKMHN